MRFLYVTLIAVAPAIVGCVPVDDYNGPDQPDVRDANYADAPPPARFDAQRFIEDAGILILWAGFEFLEAMLTGDLRSNSGPHFHAHPAPVHHMSPG